MIWMRTLNSARGKLQMIFDKFFERVPLESFEEGVPDNFWPMFGETGFAELPTEEENEESPIDLAFKCMVAQHMCRYTGLVGLSVITVVQMLMTNLVSRLLQDSTIRDDLVEALIQCKDLISLAVSEKPHGANPKYITTAAERRGKKWVLNGQKSFCTNGPEATWFVVIAETGQSGSHKYFNAFLIHRNNPGLIIKPDIPMEQFQPSRHCPIELVDCHVEDTHILGEVNYGYDQVAVEFRQYEELCHLGTITGALQYLLDLLGYHHKQSPGDDSYERETKLGTMKSICVSLEFMLYSLTVTREGGVQEVEYLPVVIGMKELVSNYMNLFEEFVIQHPILPQEAWEPLCQDVAGLMHLTAKLDRSRRLKIWRNQ